MHHHHHHHLARLQSLVGGPGQPECILAIGGPDGDNNEGSASLLQYVGLSLADAYGSLMVLTRSSVFVYTPSPDVPLPASWPSRYTRHVCGSGGEDADADDEAKAQLFFDAMSSVTKVGVPLTPRGASGGDAMELEAWPMIQLHALEGDGRPGTFFTRVKEVVDVTTTLSAVVYSDLATSLCMEASVARLMSAWGGHV